MAALLCAIEKNELMNNKFDAANAILVAQSS